MEFISRKEAKEKGLTRYFTGKPCPHNHNTERMVSNGYCVKCSEVNSKQYVQNNSQKVREAKKTYQQNNPGKKSQWDKTYYSNHKDKILERQRFRYVKTKEQHAISVSKWKRDNADKVRMYNASRKKAIKQATPSWITADDKFITQEIYYAAVALEKCTGVSHHVDHIVPLKGKNVCGLNVWWNLRPLPATENLRKSNSFREL